MTLQQRASKAFKVGETVYLDDDKGVVIEVHAYNGSYDIFVCSLTGLIRNRFHDEITAEADYKFDEEEW